MEPDKREAAFLKQARRGVASWRLQRQMATLLVFALLVGAAYVLWMALQSDAALADVMWPVLVWLALAVASSIWAIHAEIMEGAATAVQAMDAAGGPAPRVP